jgi:hypothetical protein
MLKPQHKQHSLWIGDDVQLCTKGYLRGSPGRRRRYAHSVWLPLIYVPAATGGTFIGTVVDDTFEKYRQYRYRYRLKKVSSIPISILNLKSIADTDTDTFVYDFSTTGDIRRRISGNTTLRYTAVTVKKPLAYR